MFIFYIQTGGLNIMLTMIQPFKEITRRRLVICESPLQIFQVGKS
jgi:hypothetical protein